MSLTADDRICELQGRLTENSTIRTDRKKNGKKGVFKSSGTESKSQHLCNWSPRRGGKRE